MKEKYETLIKVADEARARKGYYTDFDDIDTSKLHQISDLIHWMRTKAKGSDVREIIAQLFERTWLEGMREGNSNLEVAEARGDKIKLADRLNYLEGVLNSKANDEEFRVMLENIVSGSPKGTYNSLGDLRNAKPNGDSGIFVTTNDGHWYFWNGNSWQDGGTYQAQLTKFDANKLTEGKSQAFVRGDKFQIDFDDMTINIENPVIVDGVNNIWGRNYHGKLSNNNGMLVYNKVDEVFDFARIETFNKDHIILGFFWADGTGTVNTISPYKVRKDSVWYNYNHIKNDSITFVGHEYIYIKDLEFSAKPTLYIDNNTVVWDIEDLKIEAVNGATSGYIFYNAKTKKFTLEAIETNPKSKPKEMYTVAVMWNNGHYTENGNLKNYSFVKSIKNTAVAGNDRLITIGDSITQGLKNYNTPRELYEKPWPVRLLEYYGKTVRNVAVSGKTISGSGNEDFNGQVNSVNFIDFDVAIIAMGVNDFNVQANIEDVKESLKKGIEKIFRDNKNIKVAGILPHNLFRLPFTNPANSVYVDGLKFADRNGKTLNDFCDAIAEVYDEYYIPYIDWRKAPVLTPRNHYKWTWDAIHPNEAGHELIARRVGEWLKVNV